ncbi:MAG TPA: hypothetical protein VFW62_04355, partial [bacterium]|nr:hypothetical protein [bacterium]
TSKPIIFSSGDPSATRPTAKKVVKKQFFKNFPHLFHDQNEKSFVRNKGFPWGAIPGPKTVDFEVVEKRLFLGMYAIPSTNSLTSMGS